MQHKELIREYNNNLLLFKIYLVPNNYNYYYKPVNLESSHIQRGNMYLSVFMINQIHYINYNRWYGLIGRSN